MFGIELRASSAEEVVRFVRALGKHRYVGSRLHLVHAFAFESIEDPICEDARAWAKRALGGVIDVASKDERLFRRASDAELVAVLETFWGPNRSEDARARLTERLSAMDAAPAPDTSPFDEAREDDVFPILVDAGWELLPLSQLDGERHKGAIQSLEDFEVARFEEESRETPSATLHELPLLGPVELLHAFDGDVLRAPFVLWQEGHETYLDYVLRGVLRAARLDA